MSFNSKISRRRRKKEMELHLRSVFQRKTTKIAPVMTKMQRILA